MKFRKNPIVVEVEKVSDILNWAEKSWDNLPDWIINHYNKGHIVFANNWIAIKTDEGPMNADYNDYIICGIMGEIYPCKPNIFKLTYEKIDDTETIKNINKIINK